MSDPNNNQRQPKPLTKPDLEASLADTWEVIGSLEEKVNDLDIQVSACLVALAKLLPGFAGEFEQAQNDFLKQKRKLESALPLRVQREIRNLRNPR